MPVNFKKSSAGMSTLADMPEAKPVEWVEVPYYPNGIRAGIPADAGDIDVEYIRIPRQFAPGCCFVIPVRGQSMRDFRLHDGDELIVQQQSVAEVGQIVVANINGEYTVKAYYEDEFGRQWLLPGNPEFRPIRLTEEMGVTIQGIVMRVTYNAPHISLSECARTLRSYGDEVSRPEPSDFPLLTERALQERKAREVMSSLTLASDSGAGRLMEELHHQVMLGYVCCRNVSTARLRQLLNEHLGTSFSYENIRKNRRDER